jgi:aromatic ring-cleaving dioxygenase
MGNLRSAPVRGPARRTPGTSLPSGPCAVMLVTLPVSAPQRKRALDWLIANRIGHLVLFQAVKIHDARDAERFKAWLADAA